MNDSFLAKVKEEVQSTKVIKPKPLSQEGLMDDTGDSSDDSEDCHTDDDLFPGHCGYPVEIEDKSWSDHPVEGEHV